jgi:hypothetical protein
MLETKGLSLKTLAGFKETFTGDLYEWVTLEHQGLAYFVQLVRKGNLGQS